MGRGGGRHWGIRALEVVAEEGIGWQWDGGGMLGLDARGEVRGDGEEK